MSNKKSLDAIAKIMLAEKLSAKEAIALYEARNVIEAEMKSAKKEIASELYKQQVEIGVQVNIPADVLAYIQKLDIQRKIEREQNKGVKNFKATQFASPRVLIILRAAQLHNFEYGKVTMNRNNLPLLIADLKKAKVI